MVWRGAPPLGGGEVHLRLPVVRSLPPVSLVDEGMVKRVRGVAFSTRVSPQCSNRMVDGARGVLNDVSEGGRWGRWWLRVQLQRGRGGGRRGPEGSGLGWF